jgi:isoquinoline 1-oxidoreductase alpha subunit
MKIHVNGNRHEVAASSDTPLLWVLREDLKLTGTKFGCGAALCGACTVHLDGQPTRSCVTPVGAVREQQVATVEAMANTQLGKRVQQAWVELNVPQCGYCQPGQVMAAVALLRKIPKPTDTDIDEAMSGNLCRCGMYPRIRQAIHRIAGSLA